MIPPPGPEHQTGIVAQPPEREAFLAVASCHGIVQPALPGWVLGSLGSAVLEIKQLPKQNFLRINSRAFPLALGGSRGQEGCLRTLVFYPVSVSKIAGSASSVRA